MLKKMHCLFDAGESGFAGRKGRGDGFVQQLRRRKGRCRSPCRGNSTLERFEFLLDTRDIGVGKAQLSRIIILDVESLPPGKRVTAGKIVVPHFVKMGDGRDEGAGQVFKQTGRCGFYWTAGAAAGGSEEGREDGGEDER